MKITGMMAEEIIKKKKTFHSTNNLNSTYTLC